MSRRIGYNAAMVIFPLVGIAVGGILFACAPDGVNALSVGAMVLLVASIGGCFWAASRNDRADLEPFAKDLGLDLREVIDLGDSMRAEFGGDFLGRPVTMRIQELRPGRLSRATVYSVGISVPCANARGTQLRVVPVLTGVDRMLERLPPKLDGSWPWASGFDVHGEPAEAAAALIARVEPGRWSVLESRGPSGDFLSLLGDKCAFETTSNHWPSSALIRSRLELCVSLANAAE